MTQNAAKSNAGSNAGLPPYLSGKNFRRNGGETPPILRIRDMDEKLVHFCELIRKHSAKTSEHLTKGASDDDEAQEPLPPEGASDDDELAQEEQPLRQPPGRPPP